jgi:hypothetical protein
MVPTSAPGALLIVRIDHIWNEWTALSPEIALQVILFGQAGFSCTADRFLEYRSIKKEIGKNSWQTAKKGNMTVSAPFTGATSQQK